MGRNFLIIYTSREGSSAIVQALSCQSDIVVPLFEELDLYWIERFYGSVDICKELDDVYSKRRFQRKHDYARGAYLEENPDPDHAGSVGFKWRPHGPWDSVLGVLQKHNVVILDLLRRDLLEVTSSLYISRISKSTGFDSVISHAQFKLATMNKEDADQYRQKIENLKTPMRPLHFFSLMTWRVWRALRNRIFCWRARSRGLKTNTIYYEDFLQDPDGFIRQITDLVGVSYSVAGGGSKRTLRKATTLPAQARIQNMWMVRYNPFTYILKGAYGLLTAAPDHNNQRHEQNLSPASEVSGAPHRR